MTRIIAAAFTYAIAAFAAGFILGVIRVLEVIPRLGETLAVLLETPIMLVVSWLVSRACVRAFGVGASTTERALMGAIAFVILMLAELTLSVAVFHRSPTEYAHTFLSLAGAVGLAAQIAFALIPWIQSRIPQPDSN